MRSTRQWRDLLLRFKLMPHVPFGSEIFPGWVSLSDQPFLLCSVPAFQLFFAVDCLVHIIERLVIHETMALIVLTKTVDQIVLMLPNTPMQVISHPDIQCPRSACDHVYEIIVLTHTSYRVTPTHSQYLSSRPSGLIDEEDQTARGGTCCSLARPEPTAGPSTARIVRDANDHLRSR